MGAIIEPLPEHGPWRLELRSESFYLTALRGDDGTPVVPVVLRKDPPAVRVPVGVLAELDRALAFVEGTVQYAERPDPDEEPGDFEAALSDTHLEIAGPLRLYGGLEAVVEPLYRDLAAVRTAMAPYLAPLGPVTAYVYHFDLPGVGTGHFTIEPGGKLGHLFEATEERRVAQASSQALHELVTRGLADDDEVVRTALRSITRYERRA